jgi:sulfonate transport system permease protein
MKTAVAAEQLITKGILFKHVLISLYRVFAGFSLAFLIAFPLGIILGMNKKLLPYFEPSLEFIRHIPPLAVIPMLILWFGIGETSKLIIIVLASFFPIFLNTLNGVIYCDNKLLEVGVNGKIKGRKIGQ